MALWGKTDTLASTPKFVARKAYFDASSASVVIAASDRINLIPSNTGFSTGDAVVYSRNGGTAISGMTDGTTYYVRVVAAGQIELYDTRAHAIDTGATTGRVNITAVGTGTQTLQRTGAANSLEHNWNGKAIVFVDREEAQTTSNRVKGIKNGGWWLYSTYTDTNGNTRHKASCLVAIDNPVGSAGDASDDSIVADLAITIGTQPASQEITSGDDVTLSVIATVNGNVPLSYQWYDASDDSAVDGATSASLELANVTAEASYYVIVSASGITLQSDTADITIAV